MTFLWGAAAGLIVCWIVSAAAGLYATRHRHRWRVVTVSGGSWAEGAFAYRGMLDRCRCGRMRWRPDSPLPPWWPISDLHRLDDGHLPDVAEVQWWQDEMPRWRQRRERRQVASELHWAKRRAERAAEAEAA